MRGNNPKDHGLHPGKEIEFKILRFNPEKDKAPYYQSYRLEFQQGMTVLDAIMHLKATQDPTLSYRKSCRMGICGSCAMQVNGKPALACQTQIRELNSEVIVVRPLPNFPILRDVVPDLRDFFALHAGVKPYIIRSDSQEVDNPSGEYRQTPEHCIKCASCVAACPTCATDELFPGPQALGAAYRYVADSRDNGLEERLKILDGKNGVWRCHFAGACSEACPKGVDPALGIQLLKKEIFNHRVLGRRKEPAPVLQAPAKAERRKDIPEAPKPTVEK